MTEWIRVPFDDAVLDATSGNPKVLIGNVSSSGQYPVIDQGRQAVAGYVDDAELLCRRDKRGVILFGDHTRILKYVNFDFVLGADGVKVLEAREGFDPRFLFHYLSSITIPDNRGYSRHFKYLKRLTVPKPAIGEQQCVANTLDKADAIRRKRREAIKLADELLRSAFLDLFGDPVANSKQWPLEPIENLAVVTTGNTPSRDIPKYYGDHIEWIKSDNINTPSHYLTKATEGLSEAGLKVGRSAAAGSTLITCIAGSPACIGNAALADRPVAFNQQINALTPRANMESEFLYANVLFSKAKIQAASTQGMKGMVSKGALEQVRFIAPPPPLRARFAQVFDRVMTMTHRLESSASESEQLFSSLSARAFNRELGTP